MPSTTDIISMAEQRLEELREQLRPLLEEARQLEAMLAGARADAGKDSSSLDAMLAEAAGVTGTKRSRRQTGSRRRMAAASASGPSSLGEQLRTPRRGGRERSVADTREQMLTLMREHPTMPMKNLAAELGVTTNYLYRFLRPLREAGVLDGKGTDKKPWELDDSKQLPPLGG